MRAVTNLPLAVGFGISRPEHAAEAGRAADAIVVGSALVKLIGEYGADAALEERIEEFTRSLKTALEAA